MSKIIFLPSEDEVLVQEVQNNPVLYNIAEANYIYGKIYQLKLGNLVS